MAQGVGAKERAACSFERCALRIEGGDIVEGRAGDRVGKARTFFGDLRILEAGPDPAAHAAAMFRRDAQAGFWLGTTGMVLMSTVLTRRGSDALGGPASVGLSIGGLTMALVGANRARAARHALTRAVWHYNLGAAEGMPRPDVQAIPRGPSHPGRRGAVIGGLVGVALGLGLTSDIPWAEAPKGILATAGVGLAGGALGWTIGARRPR